MATAWREANRGYLAEQSRAYYAAHREAELEKRRVYGVAHPYRGMPAEKRERVRQQKAAQRRLHPDRMHARAAVKRALVAGRLVREPCAVCGDPRAHGHHHNGYASEHRLDVTWLCPRHHGEAHRGLRRAA